MGCCSTRDSKDKSKFDIDPKAEEECMEIENTAMGLPSLISEARDMGLLDLENEKDPKIWDLWTYYLELNENAQWDPVLYEPWLDIKKIDSSKYNSDYPVSNATITFSHQIPLKILLEQLNVPEERMKWDKHFIRFEIVDGKFMNNYVTYRQIGAFGYKGDFLDRRVVAIYKDTVVIIFYAENDELRPPTKDFNRAKSIIGIHVIKVGNGKTVIQLVQQSDLNSALARLVAKLGPKKMKDWCKELVKRINSVHPNSAIQEQTLTV
ncbi:unnamed protein product [Blepharisma stoltei]|uniref:START domain-containing protein n=1 Tax=Blepharisma stoltei TaxID=1481888 RepID=A0AAU9JB57_9CILI|nr:unnamed protein product [Blepharisma stoltei]